MVRAKFYCTSVTKGLYWDGTRRFLYTANFMPVTSGSEENKKFYAATPSGKLELGSFSQDLFEPGKEYFLDITPA